MRFTLNRFLAVSAALHFVAGLFLLLSLPKKMPESPAAVFIDLPQDPTETMAATNQKHGAGKAGGSVLGAGGAKAIPFSALAPKWKPTMNGGSAVIAGTAEESWDMQGSDAVVAPKSSAAVAWVYKKTDQVLGYPMALTKHGIQGSVNARISFDAQGRFDLSRLDVTSDSPYLRVYVYRLLEKTFFDDPVPASFRNWKDKLDVAANIRFSFTESGIRVELSHKIAGNKIYFAKLHPKSRLQWNLGPLGGMGPAVGLNLLWFAQKAKEATSNSIPVDDLAEFRNDPLFYN